MLKGYRVGTGAPRLSGHLGPVRLPSSLNGKAVGTLWSVSHSSKAGLKVGVLVLLLEMRRPMLRMAR